VASRYAGCPVTQGWTLHLLAGGNENVITVEHYDYTLVKAVSSTGNGT
jgi:hypothetical protein